MSVRKHALVNVTGALIPVAVSLMTVPAYLHRIGEARYGVLAIAWLLLSYFGLFDLGLGRATSQRIAFLVAASAQERAATLWSSLIVNLALGLLGGVLLWPVADYCFTHFFQVDAGLRVETRSGLPWLMLAVPVATTTAVLGGALEGRLRFLEINIVWVLGSAVVQCLPLVVAYWHGPDMGWLLPTVVLSRLLSAAALYWRCHIHLLRGHSAAVSRTEVARLLRFGGWVTGSSVIAPLMAMLDRLLIGAKLGVQAVTYYTVPFQLAERSGILPAALVSAVFPRLAGQDAAGAMTLALLSTRALAATFTPPMLVGVLLVEPFLRWWLSPEIASHAALTGEILIIGFWVSAFARVPYAQLQAQGRPDLVAKCQWAQLIPYIAILYLGLRYGGLPGAAIAFSVKSLADFLLVSWCAGSVAPIVRMLLVPAGLLLSALTVISLPIRHDEWRWGLAALLGVLTLAWAWRAAPPEVRAMSRGALLMQSADR